MVVTIDKVTYMPEVAVRQANEHKLVWVINKLGSSVVALCSEKVKREHGPRLAREYSEFYFDLSHRLRTLFLSKGEREVMDDQAILDHIHMLKGRFSFDYSDRALMAFGSTETIPAEPMSRELPVLNAVSQRASVLLFNFAFVDGNSYSDFKDCGRYGELLYTFFHNIMDEEATGKPLEMFDIFIGGRHEGVRSKTIRLFLQGLFGEENPDGSFGELKAQRVRGKNCVYMVSETAYDDLYLVDTQTETISPTQKLHTYNLVGLKKIPKGYQHPLK